MVHTLQRSITHPYLVACSIQHNLLIIYTVSTSLKTLELSVKYQPRKTPQISEHAIIVSHTSTSQNTPSPAAHTPPSQHVLCFAAHAPTVSIRSPLLHTLHTL